MQNLSAAINELPKFTVRITAGEMIGSGIIVTKDGLILTCHHIIKDVLKEKDPKIEISFPLLKIKDRAKIFKIDEVNDLAFLRLEGKHAYSREADISIANLSLEVLPGNIFHSYGFKYSPIFKGGLEVSGSIGIETMLEEQDKTVIQLTSDGVKEGMSGSPVLDAVSKKIIGIISQGFRKKDDNDDVSIATAIPIYLAVTLYPQLEQENPGLNKFLQLSPTLRNHLKHTRQKAEEKIFGHTLSSTYIQHSGILVGTDTWNMKDEEVGSLLGETSSIKAQNIIKLLEDELSFSSGKSFDSSGPPYIVVAGSYGIGKTAFSKFFAAYYAIKYLGHEQNKGGNGTSGDYIPIFLSLKESSSDGTTLYDEYKPLKSILVKLFPDHGNGRSDERILLILDGLDDYKGTPQQLINMINDYSIEYPLRAIITTRLNEEVPDNLRITNQRYARLLPFENEIQINKFFENYGISNLTSGVLLNDLALPFELIAKPLFLLMISSIYRDPSKSRKFFDTHWSVGVKKCLIHMNFFNSIIEERYKEKAKKSNEKEILRIIAALKYSYGDNLKGEIEALRKEVLRFDSAVDTSQMAKIRETYFYTRTVGATNEKTIDFTYDIFKEYLLAEYFLENVLSNRIHRIYGMPTQETVEFLDGLVEILEDKGNNIVRTLNEIGIDIPYSFYPNNYERQVDIQSARRELLQHSIECINDSKLAFFNPSITNEENVWKDAVIKSENYHLLWLHRWICLHILIVMGYTSKVKENEVNKSQLSNLIRSSISLMPKHLRIMNGCDLSNCDLSNCDLSNAIMFSSTLTRSNLSGSKLIEAKMSYADLTGISIYPLYRTAPQTINSLSVNSLSDKLKETLHNLPTPSFMFEPAEYTDMSHAVLSHSYLNFATISGAKLVHINLSDADLSNAILIGIGNITKINKKLEGGGLKRLFRSFIDSFLRYLNISENRYLDLTHADLSRAKLMNATMVGVNLSETNLSSADLTSAILIYVDLESADLTSAKLKSSTIINCVSFKNLKCDKADFQNASIHDPQLLQYLKSRAVNVPDEVPK